MISLVIKSNESQAASFDPPFMHLLAIILIEIPFLGKVAHAVIIWTAAAQCRFIKWKTRDKHDN